MNHVHERVHRHEVTHAATDQVTLADFSCRSAHRQAGAADGVVVDAVPYYLQHKLSLVLDVDVADPSSAAGGGLWRQKRMIEHM